MQRIINLSSDKIEWDAQSAFKITNYYVNSEEHMIFTYLRLYVSDGDLKLCSYTFDRNATGKNDLRLVINLHPEEFFGFLDITFGIDGISHSNFFKRENLQDKYITLTQDASRYNYHSYNTNDQQGYYWCGEFTIPKSTIFEIFKTDLSEKSLISLNLYKLFYDSADYACLFEDTINDEDSVFNSMREFVVLKY